MDQEVLTMEKKEEVSRETAPSLTKSQIAELEKPQSLTRIVYTQFKEHKAAVVGIYTIIFFVLLALSAPLIEKVTGLDSESQNVFARYKPPFTRVSVAVDGREEMVKKYILANPEDADVAAKELIKEEFVATKKN